MSPEDFEIWQRYRDTATRDALWVFYDVGLGSGKPYEGPEDENLRLMWLMNTQKRADVIIQRRNHIDIIELRHAATANAVGRLLQYRMLYLRDPVLGKPVVMTLVTNLEDPELRDLCKQYSIRYIVV